MTQIPAGWEKPAVRAMEAEQAAAEAAAALQTSAKPSLTATAATPAAEEAAPMTSTTSTTSSSTPAKVTWLSKVGAVVGKVLKAVATVAKPVADIATPVLEALFPQFAAPIAAADNLVTKIATEAVAVESAAAAAGTQTGTGAQKLEAVLQATGPAINAWVAANFPGAKEVSTAAQAGLVNAVVAILNEIDPAAAIPGSAVVPTS